MAPLTKDLLESPTSTSESHGAGSPVIRTPGAHLRSDALSLEVPIKVHGSKVTQVVREITPHTEPFEEQTTTMIVFPQGGVLKMSTMVSAGQMLVVTNLRSKQDAICRVVKVRMFSNSQAYVEVEFTNRQQGYWGVYFPSDGPTSSHSPAATDSPVASLIKSATPVAPRSAIPQPAATRPAIAPPATAAPLVPPAAKKRQSDTVFAPIGSQEEVQLAADTTFQKRASSGAEDFSSPSLSFAPEPARASSAEPITANPVANLAPPVSLQDLRGDRSSAPAFSAAPFSHSVEADSDRPGAAAGASTFGAFSGAGVLSGGLGSARQSGSAEDYSSYSHSEPGAADRSPKWIVLVAVAVIFAALGGGAIYFKMMPAKPVALNAPKANSPAANGQPTGAQVAPLVAPTPASDANLATSSTVVARDTKSTPVVSAANAPLTPSAIVRAHADEPPAATKSNQPHSTAAAAPESSVPKQPVSAFASGALNAKLNAHPRAAKSKANLAASDAPDVPALSSAPSGALSGILPGGSATPPPPMPSPAPAAPVRMGGQIQQPRLISRVLPVYPIGAKNSHVEGDVVINISIGKDGKVTEAKVVSGPSLLRQAAVDAVRRWKYQPSKLDGEPIASQTQVTVGFHL